MAESQDTEKPTAVLSEVPTRITAPQIIALILALAAMRTAQGLLAPLMLAVMIALALAPLVKALSRIIPRWIASALVVVAISGAFGFTMWALSDDITTFSRRLPAMVREVRTLVQSATPRQSLIQQLQQAVTELQESAGPKKPTDATPVTIVDTVDVQRQMMSGAQTVGGYVANAILLTFLIYFLLAQGDMFKQKFVRLSGERLSQKKVTVQMIDEMTAQIGQFVFYQFWSGLLVGLLTWAAFAYFGMAYAGLWGVAAGVLNCIPYFGPTLILAASAAAAFMQFREVSIVLMVAVAGVAITSLEGFVLAPIALGRAASVNTVAVFVSVMFWGWMWGPLGLVMAVPILMCIKVICDHVESLAAFSELLGDRDA